MSGALRYEWVRLRTLRSTWWLLGISLLVSALVAFAVGWVARTNEIGIDPYAAALTGGSAFTPIPLPAFLLALTGVFAFGHEYRYGTIRPTLGAVPRRGRIFLAKAVVVSLWVALAAVLHVALSWAVGALVAGDDWTRYGFAWDPVGRVALGFVVLFVLWALVGLAFAGLLRNLPAAVVALLVIPLVVEGLLFAILVFVPALESIRAAGSYLPFSAGQQMLITLDFGQSGGAPIGIELLSPLEGGLVFAAFAGLLLAAAVWLIGRRDA